MVRRSPEQVHADGGHDQLVRSCALCQAAGGQPAAAPPAPSATAPGVDVAGDLRPDLPDAGPLPEVGPVRYAEDDVSLPVERIQYVNGRPKCYVEACVLPEFADGVGLCGGHWTIRPDLRKAARHGR